MLLALAAACLVVLMLVLVWWHYRKGGGSDRFSVFPDCPYNWKQAGGVCMQPADYTGSCQTESKSSKFDGYSDTDKALWGINCGVSWFAPPPPPPPSPPQPQLDQPCPYLWAQTPDGKCQPPAPQQFAPCPLTWSRTGGGGCRPNIAARCNVPSMFDGYDYNAKSSWARGCNAPWYGYWWPSPMSYASPPTNWRDDQQDDAARFAEIAPDWSGQAVATGALLWAHQNPNNASCPPGWAQVNSFMGGSTCYPTPALGSSTPCPPGWLPSPRGGCVAH